MISRGFPPNFPLNDAGWTLLHVAAQVGNEGLVETLLRQGANPNVQEANENWTPLHVAALNGHADLVSLLLKSGAKRTIQDKLGLTPRELAKQYHMRSIVALIDSTPA
jgi:ankyrin repeat protein